MSIKERWNRLAFGSNGRNQNIISETINTGRNLGLQGALKGKLAQYQVVYNMLTSGNLPSDWVVIGATRTSSGADTLFGKVSGGNITELYEVEVKDNSGSSKVSSSPSQGKPKITGSGESYIKSPTPALKVLMADLVANHLHKSVDAKTHIVDWSAATPANGGPLSAAGWSNMALDKNFIDAVNNGTVGNFALDTADPKNILVDASNSSGTNIDVLCIGYCSVVGRSTIGVAYHGYGSIISLTEPDYVKVANFDPATGGMDQASSFQACDANGKAINVSATTMSMADYQVFRGGALVNVGHSATLQDSWNNSANTLCAQWASSFSDEIVQACGIFGIPVAAAVPTADETKTLLILMSSSVIKGSPASLDSSIPGLISKAVSMIGANADISNCVTVFTTCILDGMHGVPYIAGNISKNNRSANYTQCFKRALDYVNGPMGSTDALIMKK